MRVSLTILILKYLNQQFFFALLYFRLAIANLVRRHTQTCKYSTIVTALPRLVVDQMLQTTED
jgi:hypothetical protein